MPSRSPLTLASLLLLSAVFACDPAPVVREAAPRPSPPPVAVAALATPPSAPPSGPVASERKPEVPAPARPRFKARVLTPVLLSPSRGAFEVGQLAPGDSSEIAEGEAPRAADGCPQGYLALRPLGWVCPSESAADAGDEPDRAAPFHLRRDVPYPASYGESLGAPVYLRVSDEGEQERMEPGIDVQRALIAQARKAAMLGKEDEIPQALRGVELISPADPCPPAWKRVAEGSPLRGTLPRGAGVAWVGECEAEARTWLVTPELWLIPRDRVARAPASAFRGEALSGTTRLAFVTGKARPGQRMVRNGYFEPDGELLPLRSVVRLTGESKSVGAFTYLETTEPGRYVLSDHLSVVEATPPPAGVGRDGRWIDVQVSKGLLVAYEGPRPVYATLCSAPLATALDDGGARRIPTRGVFPLEWKHRTRSFGEGSARPRPYLPHVQQFGGALALVGDPYQPTLGAPGPGASVRLSPIDAAHLFRWTSPELPEGWSSRRSGSPGEAVTLVQIRD